MGLGERLERRGLQKGRQEGRQEVAKRLLEKGLETTLILEVTGLTEEMLGALALEQV